MREFTHNGNLLEAFKTLVAQDPFISKVDKIQVESLTADSDAIYIHLFENQGYFIQCEISLKPSLTLQKKIIAKCRRA